MKSMRKWFGWLVVGAVAIALAIPTLPALTPSTYAAEDEQEKESDKAVQEAKMGWEELDKVDKKLDAGKAKDASKAFNSAVGHFSKALEYLADSMLSDEQKQGVELLDKGSKELDKAAKELDKGNIDDAQKYYDDAMDMLEQGLDLLS